MNAADLSLFFKEGANSFICLHIFGQYDELVLKFWTD